MPTPIILLVGQANSGKDSAAKIIATNHNAAILSLADPIKRFALKTFNFTEQQLWGPSAFRNARDTRFLDGVYSEAVLNRVRNEASDFLVELLGATSLDRYGAVVQWAKEMVQNAAHVQGGLTPRQVLQTLGTEVFRKMAGSEVWIDYGKKLAFQLLDGGYTYSRTEGLVKTLGISYGYIIISDGRFRNEILSIKAIDGKIFQIKPPAPPTDNVGIKGHQSEAEQLTIPTHWYDAVLLNNKDYGLGALEEVVDEAMAYCFGGSGQLFEPVENLIQAAAAAAGVIKEELAPF